MLTGSNDEWKDTGFALQNVKCPSVYKSKITGEAYHMNAIVFVEKAGIRFTCAESHIKITFPYIPKTTYIYEGTLEAQPYKELFEMMSETRKER